ncbi:MAG: hypothetical protein HQ506_03590 [Candidatus Marinimicrobia bacterium]|nr:hypothetical protein [Candidatus Neomarinimicrobiota bacterium]
MFFDQTRILTRVISVVLIFSLILPTATAFGQEATVDYYYEGQAAAQRDYTGGGAVVGGLAAGFLLGLIGWGLGYLIVSSQDGDVPKDLTTNLNTTQRMRFEQGYKDYVMRTKKGKFNLGAGIGTIGAVLFVMSSSE